MIAEQKVTLTKLDSGKIAIKVDGLQLAAIVDGTTIVQRADVELVKAGFHRTTGYWPNSRNLALEADVREVPGAGIMVGA